MKTSRLVGACVVAAAGLLSFASAAEPPPGSTEAAVEAGKLYETANSQYRLRQWGQAEPLFDQFVRKFPTNENVPTACIQLAYCRRALKRMDEYVDILENVTTRFQGSAYWFTAWGALLDKAREDGDKDGYFNRLETMARYMKVIPLHLPTDVPYDHNWLVEDPRVRYHDRSYAHPSQNVWDYTAPMAEYPRDVRRGSGGWIVGMLDMVDTPERAQRALRALAATLKLNADDLPAGWQFVHVKLLERAGLDDQAAKAWEECLAQWGESTEAVALWVVKYDYAVANKDEKTADEVMETLLSQYGKFPSLRERFGARFAALYQQKRYDEFKKLAQFVVETFPESEEARKAVGLWIELAKLHADSQDTSTAQEALKLTEQIPLCGNPALERSSLQWRIRLHAILKEFDRGAELAQQLVGEKHWCASSFEVVKSYVRENEAFGKVVESARKKWDIPVADPGAKAAELLKEFRARLKDDQARHAEEIGEEMFRDHTRDGSTIAAVGELVDYYFRKVLPEPRDKWMERMINAYPHHPDTEKVLWQQIVAQRAAQRYDLLAKALDLFKARFPGAVSRGWVDYRVDCYNAVKDSDGLSAFVRGFFGDRAEAGDVEALDGITRVERAFFGETNELVGDGWTRLAGKLQGREGMLTCLERAWLWYWYGPRYNPNHYGEAIWEKGLRTAEAFASQTVDPEIAWRMEFADVNVAARADQAQQAMQTADGRIDLRKKYRNLTLRLDLPALGGALGKGKLIPRGMAMVSKLQRVTFTDVDGDAMEVMQARMHQAAENWPVAAKHYFNLVTKAQWPAYRYGFLHQGASCLERAASGGYAAALEAYVSKIKNVQEMAPRVLYLIGYDHARRNSPAAMVVRGRLAREYPDSFSLSQLQVEIEARVARMKK